MVSKTAVIAIVLIIAAPIFIGYVFNIDQVSVTDYKTTGDAVNVTQILQNSVDYNYVNADTTQINTSFVMPKVTIPYDNTDDAVQSLARYEKTGYVKTVMPMNKYTYGSGNLPYSIDPPTTSYYYFETDGSGSGYVNLEIYNLSGGTTLLTTITAIKSAYSTSTDLYYTYYVNPNNHTATEMGTYHYPSSSCRCYFQAINGYSGNAFVERHEDTDTDFVDLSAGFRIKADSIPYRSTKVQLPKDTRSILMTVNIDSMAGLPAGVTIYSNGITVGTLVKTDIGGELKLQGRFTGNYFDMYYDPTRSDNTYQILVTYEYVSSFIYNGQTANVYNTHTEFRYVGGWPSIMGVANYYKIYTNDREDQAYDFNSDYVMFTTTSSNGYTPIIRMDAATFRTNEFPVIYDKTYSPSSFKDNPITKIINPTQYGTSIEFAGNTYNVTDGNITLEGRSIPVKDLTFSSIPSSLGGYENKIGNTVISTSAQPSTITFNGKWAVGVETTEQESYTYTETEWIPGDFAWDGMDQNFILAGLLVSLGAFVGVGIYARRSRASIWPLLIVCGGAALLFFIML